MYENILPNNDEQEIHKVEITTTINAVSIGTFSKDQITPAHL
jgi:hypothetical protein